MRWVIDSADAQSIVSTRREIANHITSESRGNADAFMVELITGEILAAEWYRHAGAIAVEVEWQNDNAVLDVYDQGPALDLSQVVDPMDQPADMMLRRFADALQIEHTEQGNHIRIALPARRESGTKSSRRLWEFAAALVGHRSKKVANRHAAPDERIR
ncbi:MAG: ATP-binding protein [Candidatus Baltobacteraceae bacterium]